MLSTLLILCWYTHNQCSHIVGTVGWLHKEVFDILKCAFVLFFHCKKNSLDAPVHLFEGVGGSELAGEAQSTQRRDDLLT